MKKKEKAARTYIQGNISPAQQSHMDLLGFGFPVAPGEFRAKMDSYANTVLWRVTAKHDVLTPASQLPMHSHNYLEIFHYTSESQVEYLIGSQRYIVQKGDIICVPPGICHQVLRYEPQNIPCSRDLIAVGADFLESIGWNYQPEQYYLLRANNAGHQELGNLCALCVREYERQELRWRDMLSSYVQIILTQLFRDPKPSIQAEPGGFFEQLLAYINSNLSLKLTLTETALHFFTSERTITREFQKNLGTSFYRYVTQRRLLTARNLIFNDMPLMEVCRRVGFEDYPTFFRAFKKEYGISPREMREIDAMLNQG